MTKIIAISDTHGKEAWLDLPECDILLFCGDFGIVDKQLLSYANYWFGKQKAKHKIFVAGNHDRELEQIGKYKTKELFTNVIYLENDLVEVEGLKIYGSPFSPEFNHWSFMYQRCGKTAKRIWEKIPENLDILVTHCPPYGILDRNYTDERCGCEVLVRELFDKRPKYHFFGHIHGYGETIETQEDTTFINCSVLNEEYKLKNNPIILEL